MADLKADVKADGQKEDVQFDNILNFRDVGKTINVFLGERRVAEGRIFRSARPDDATLSDRRRLKEQYGIKTIMDLRTVTEHANQAKKRDADLKVPTIVQSNDALSEPLQIPGMKYLEVNVNGKGFERSLLWQLSWWNITKLVTLMIFGYRMEAISILGSRAFTSLPNFGILVHCTQGKDRTGLIISLILFLLEVPINAISNDYCLSEEELLPERESRLKEIKSIGLSEDFAGCPKDWIEKMHEYLQEKYGGVKEYCEKIGFGKYEQDKLIELLKV